MFQNPFFRLSVALMSIVVVLMSWGRLDATSKPAVGSSNVAVADPPVPVPDTEPCTVQLFPAARFGAGGPDARLGARPHSFSYQPPSGCKGSWAKVVLEANFSVDAGRQYDRTASIWLKGVNLYFGTTEEPSRNFGPSWQIERDLTDYSSLLRSPGEGVAQISNWINARRPSFIHASARILFYPADTRFPAPRTPDVIYPLNSSGNLPAKLQTPESQLQRKIVFPRNTTRVYMDLFAESQAQDEPWYSCLPEKYIERITAIARKRGHQGTLALPSTCAGGSFREGEVTIDGTPAGLAPIYPWIYTGGIDPFLWRPTPGVETLNFIPYRLNLTPFAGLLSNGEPHTVAVRVLGAHHYFSVSAALLVYRDRKAKQTEGAVTRNTLQGASLKPTVTGTLGNNLKGVNGDVVTRARQSYVIEGYVKTPAGRANTRVGQSLSFANTQKYTTVNARAIRQVIEQVTHAESTSSSTGGSSTARRFQRSLNYSLTINALRRANSSHSAIHNIYMDQTFNKHIEQREAGLPPYQASVRNTRTTSAQVIFNFGPHSQVNLSGNTGQNSMQDFSFSNSLGDCYHAKVKALGGKVSSFTQGQGCSGKAIHWFVHPDGSPDSFGWRANTSR